MENQSYIDKLVWIHIVDCKVLCALSKGKDAYYLPGGKRETGETDEQALIREVCEELSVDLVADTIRRIEVFEAQAHGKPPGVQVRMTCYAADYRGELRAASEIAAIAWLTHQDKDKTSPVVKLIFDWLHEQGLIAD